MEKNILKAILPLVRKTGEYIAKEGKNFSQDKIEYKDINNVVSYVDKTAEEMLVEGLYKAYPEAGFITEEEVTRDVKKEINWIIDPLDGTANFMHGLPHYAISVALVHGKDPILGVVYHISADAMYTAIKGAGAFKDEVPILVSKAARLEESLMATGFPYYKFQDIQKYLQILEALMQKTHGLRRFGSAALDLCYVAEGRYDGFFEYNLNSWDMAAGVLLVTEAGGRVSDFKGEQNFLFQGDIVAGNAHQKMLLDTIQKYW